MKPYLRGLVASALLLHSCSADRSAGPPVEYGKIANTLIKDVES